MDKDKISKNIKNGGSVAIYIGTASIVKPIVKRHQIERNPFSQICSTFAGTVISCGISSVASKWFGTAVDKVINTLDEWGVLK